MGCRVVAWEPVPTFRAFLALGATLNNVSHRIHVRARVASDAPAPSVQIAVPRRGIAGTASLVADWANFGSWTEKGELTASQRATGIWKDIVERPTKLVHDDARVESLQAYITAASAAGGAAPES